METVTSINVDPSGHTQQPICDNEDKVRSTRKITYTFNTQPFETDLKKLLTQVTGKTDLTSATEVRLKVVSGHAGLHRLSNYTPHLRILTLDGSCIASFRDLGSNLNSLTTLSVVRCSMKHMDGVWGFASLEDLNVSDNFISDPSPCSGVKKLSKLDIRRNQITDFAYFAFLRSCSKLKQLYVADNQFSDYKEDIRKLIPQLRILDGEDIECFYPSDAAASGTETEFVSDDENPSSEGGSSTSLSFSVEDINLVGRHPTDDPDGVDQDEYENVEKSTSLDDYRIQNYSSTNDSDASINAAHESSPGRLSCRVICGNLAVSLRTRNPTKLIVGQSLVVPRQSRDDLKLEEGNQEDREKMIDDVI